MSSKIDVLENLASKVDALVIGGGMANTFLLAKGIAVGKSLAEPDLADTAQADHRRRREGRLADRPAGRCGRRGGAQGRRREPRRSRVDAVPADQMILDVGPKSVDAVNGWIDKAATLVWNGPLGAFEMPPFDKATVAAATARRRAHQGRQAAVGRRRRRHRVAPSIRPASPRDFSFVSTAGGAFLEWMEGKALPGVEVLRKRS